MANFETGQKIGFRVKNKEKKGWKLCTVMRLMTKAQKFDSVLNKFLFLKLFFKFFLQNWQFLEISFDFWYF